MFQSLHSLGTGMRISPSERKAEGQEHSFLWVSDSGAWHSHRSWIFLHECPCTQPSRDTFPRISTKFYKKQRQNSISEKRARMKVKHRAVLGHVIHGRDMGREQGRKVWRSRSPGTRLVKRTARTSSSSWALVLLSKRDDHKPPQKTFRGNIRWNYRGYINLLLIY